MFDVQQTMYQRQPTVSGRERRTMQGDTQRPHMHRSGRERRIQSAATVAGEEATQQTAALPQTDAQVLAAEFPAIDAGLIEVMLEDQGGDAADVRFALRVRLPVWQRMWRIKTAAPAPWGSLCSCFKRQR